MILFSHNNHIVIDNININNINVFHDNHVVIDNININNMNVNNN